MWYFSYYFCDKLSPTAILRDLDSLADSTKIQKSGTTTLIKLKNHNWFCELLLDYLERINSHTPY